MSLNSLLHRHQVSLMRSQAGSSPDARTTHLGLVDGYAARIHDLRAETGADVSSPMSAEQPLGAVPSISLRKAFVPRLARLPMLADAATRQGRAATLAWQAFGDRDAAVADLNTVNDALGGRPIDIAMASASGLTAVEASISARVRLTGGEVVSIRKFAQLDDEPNENPDRGGASPSVDSPATTKES